MAGVIFSADVKAQNTTGYGSTNGSTDAWGGAPGMGTGTRQRQGNPDAAQSPSQGQDSDVPDSDTMYRMKTKDSLASGAMARDDGQLTAKVLRREKVSKVDAKQLPTSGTDPKFQGSLLQSSVGSISEIGAKAHVDNTRQQHTAEQPIDLQNLSFQPKAEEHQKEAEQEIPDAAAKEENEARFKARQLMFGGDEAAKKTESPRTKANSSPSPSPSPDRSASPSSR